MTIFTAFLLSAYTISLWTSMAAMEILGWLLVLLAIVQILVRRIRSKPVQFADLLITPNRRFGIDTWLAVFLVGACIGAVLQDRAPWLRVAGESRWIILLYALNFHLKSLTRSRWEAGLRFMAWPMTAAGAYGFFQFLTGVEFFRAKQVLYPYGHFWRATGFFSVSLTYGCLMAMGVAVAGALFLLAPPKKSRMLFLLAWISMALGLLAGLTRGTWIGLAVAVYFVLFVVLKRRAIYPLIVVTLIAAALFGINDSSRGRLMNVFDLNSASYSVRISLWKANFEMFKDHPLFGVGYSQSSHYVREYYERLNLKADLVGHAHNVYVQLLSTTGLIGLISYLGFSLGFLIMAWQAFKTTRPSDWQIRGVAIGSLTALLAFHIAGLSEANFTDAEITHFVIFLWANLATLNHLSNEGRTLS